MQSQINAIKQLLETNNITAGQIEEILVKALGDRASWEDSSTCNELADIEDKFGKDEAEIPLEIRWILELLWRSRIDLNNAKLNAEEVDLENFLSKSDGTAQVAESRLKQVLSLEKQLETRDQQLEDRDQQLEDRDRMITRMDTEINSLRIDVKDRDREIALLKADLYGFTENRKLENNKDRQVQELQITAENHRDLFNDLKSHFRVTLKAIAMNLNGLKGERKPDHVETVDGVQYDDNLTHHHKTIIIENLQRAIAEEAKKLKSLELKDFSFDEISF